MTPEKCHIEVLLNELCEQLNAAHLPAVPACCTKWLKKDDRTWLEKIVDPRCLDTATFLALTDKLKTLETYDSLLEALSSHPSFSNAPKAAGHWGLPSTLVQEVLHDASEVVDSTVHASYPALWQTDSHVIVSRSRGKTEKVEVSR